MEHSRLRYGLMVAGIALYSVVTIVPFYFLFIRSFISTRQSSEVHLWIPPAEPLNPDITLGGLSQYYGIDIRQFKADLNITGYVPPLRTVREIAEENRIPMERMSAYVRPYVAYGGWRLLLYSRDFYRSLGNTLFVTTASILLGGFLGILTGAGLAGLRRRWHMAAYNTYLLSMVIPPVAVMIPTYLIVTQWLHLQDTLWIPVLLNIKGTALSTMLFTSYIGSLPKDLRDAVEIDGGGRLTYLFRVVFPLCKTPFAVYATIVLPWYWNDLLTPFLFLQKENYTLMPFVNSFIGEKYTNMQAIFTSLFLSILPLVLVYLAARKLFIRGALAGAVKG